MARPAVSHAPRYRSKPFAADKFRLYCGRKLPAPSESVLEVSSADVDDDSATRVPYFGNVSIVTAESVPYRNTLPKKSVTTNCVVQGRSGGRSGRISGEMNRWRYPLGYANRLLACYGHVGTIADVLPPAITVKRSGCASLLFR